MFSQTVAKELGVTAFVTTLIAKCFMIIHVVPAVDGDQPVYFSLMVSSAPTLDTSRVVSAVDQALQHINSDTEVLPGYHLQYSQVLDAQVRQILDYNDFVSDQYC